MYACTMLPFPHFTHPHIHTIGYLVDNAPSNVTVPVVAAVIVFIVLAAVIVTVVIVIFCM